MIKFIKIIVVIQFLGISYSKNITGSNNLISDKWISVNNPYCEVWFQNWVEYTRLFIVIYEDTLNIDPDPYATQTKGKPFLMPIKREIIQKQQLIGNIYWDKSPKWESGEVNEFKWIVDRANPKILLPHRLNGVAMQDNGKLELNITENDQPYINLKLKKINY